MTLPIRAQTLGAWREHVAGVSQAEAAKRTGMRPLDVSRLESNPERATLGALLAYVQALGGRVTITLETDTTERRLIL